MAKGQRMTRDWFGKDPVRDWFDKDPVREFSLRDETTVALNVLGSYELIHVASFKRTAQALTQKGCAQSVKAV
jgi:hypothetical protein